MGKDTTTTGSVCKRCGLPCPETYGEACRGFAFVYDPATTCQVWLIYNHTNYKDSCSETQIHELKGEEK